MPSLLGDYVGLQNQGLITPRVLTPEENARARQRLGQFGRGMATAPLTWAPDLAGLLTQGVNAATDYASKKNYYRSLKRLVTHMRLIE